MKLKSVDSCLSFFKDKKGLLKIGFFVILGLLLIVFGMSERSTESSGSSVNDEEERIAGFCSSVNGVGRCVVHITYESELDRYGRERSEKILGIAVLCEGGDRVEIKERLSDLISALYGIGANRVRIDKLKK